MAARRALTFSFLQKYSTVGINFVSTVILARLLTPEEIGIFAVAVAIVGIAHTFRDFGVSNYIVQEQELTPARIRAAVTVTLIIAWAIAAALAAGGPFLAAFYQEPGMTPVFWVLAINFVVLPFSSVVMALYRRELRFGLLYRIQILAELAAAGTAVGFAASGFGFMSLAYGQLAQIAVTLLLANIARPGFAHLLPGFAGLRRVLSFGSAASGAAILREVGNRSPELIMGRMLDFAAVGLYSRAMGLLSIVGRLVIQGVEPVALPIFAAKQRGGGDLPAGCRTALSYMDAICWPCFAFLGLMAEPAILFLFGDQWVGAVPLVHILAVSALYSSVPVIGRAILVSVGRINDVLRLQMMVVPVQVLAIFSASFFGLEAVAWSTVFTGLLIVALYCRYLFRHIGFSFVDLLRVWLVDGRVMLVASVGPAAAAYWGSVADPAPVLQLLAGGVGLAVGWLAAVALFRHPILAEYAPVRDYLLAALKRSRSRSARTQAN
jgi:O-antigen/teichoic acid export membrane protein